MWELIQWGHIIDTPKNTRICTMAGDGKEMIKNARLIAAAPTMYEACHAAVVALTAAISDFQTDDDDAIIEDAFKKLNAAIAKAEGRSEE